MARFIYALCDPSGDTIRYIGQTGSPNERLRCHIAHAKCSHPRGPVRRWIQSLLAVGKLPVFKTVAIVEDEMAFPTETAYVRALKSAGVPLLNTAGSPLQSEVFARVPGELHRRMKAAAALRGLTIKDFLADLIRQTLEAQSAVDTVEKAT